MARMMMTVLAVARGVLLALEIALAIPLLYLLALAIGAAIGTLRIASSRRKNDQANTATFAILVPAHNEELLIGKTLSSLATLEYPTDRYAVHVIADNCTDRTAEIAQAAGAKVL